MARKYARVVLTSGLLIAGLLLAGAGPAGAATPTIKGAPDATGQLDSKTFASVKKELDSSNLAKSTTISGGVLTTFYTLPGGSMLSLSEPTKVKGTIAPAAYLGGCGFLRLCVWLNRGDQLIVAAGSFAALTALICLAGPAACVVAAAVAAAVFQAISNRGYICPHYMVVEVLFSPGVIRACY